MIYDASALKKIKNRRNCRTAKIWGWILLVMGVLSLFGETGAFDLSTFMISLMIIAAGVLLLVTSIRKVRKWDKYESFINNHGNTPIPFLAEKMGQPPEKVRADVQDMINRNFFIYQNGNVDAYINGKYDMLILSVNGIPLEPLNSGQSPNAAGTAAGSQSSPQQGTQQSAKTDRPATYAELIHMAAAKTQDESVRQALAGIERSINRVGQKLREQPELGSMDSVARMKTSYIPKTMALLKKYNEGSLNAETTLKVEEVLKNCAKAFGEIENKIFERDNTETQVDVDVLTQMLEREGLLGSDFDIK